MLHDGSEALKVTVSTADLLVTVKKKACNNNINTNITSATTTNNKKRKMKKKKKNMVDILKFIIKEYNVLIKVKVTNIKATECFFYNTTTWIKAP